MAMAPKKKVAKKAPAKKKIPALMRPIVVVPEDGEDLLGSDSYFGGDVLRGTFDQEVAKLTKQMEDENSVYGRDECFTVYEVKVLRRATIRRNKVSVEMETF